MEPANIPYGYVKLFVAGAQLALAKPDEFVLVRQEFDKDYWGHRTEITVSPLIFFDDSIIKDDRMGSDYFKIKKENLRKYLFKN
ncbi:MAG: hypothetical protein PHT40_00840 [Patescibacteria group bacterium]|nr:hypothetical protein [Patescibacteria group bacterium]